jgi:hypothetical protein
MIDDEYLIAEEAAKVIKYDGGKYTRVGMNRMAAKGVFGDAVVKFGREWRWVKSRLMSIRQPSLRVDARDQKLRRA